MNPYKFLFGSDSYSQIFIPRMRGIISLTGKMSPEIEKKMIPKLICFVGIFLPSMHFLSVYRSISELFTDSNMDLTVFLSNCNVLIGAKYEFQF